MATITNFSESIRTIAKTKELVEKVDKLTQSATETALVKAALDRQRTVGYTDVSGASYLSIGATAGASATSVTGTGASGNPVTGPPAPPPTNKLGADKTTTSAIDAAKESINDNNIDEKKKDGTADTDLSDKGHETNNGGGGSPFADQGLLGENNPDWLAIKEAMEAAGASENEIASARIAFLKKELGIDEVGDVFEGLAGAKPADQSDSLSGQGANHPTGGAGNKQIQRGFVGVDPNNPAKALLVRMDGLLPLPSDYDSFRAFQDSWADGVPTKKGFQLGYNWANGAPDAAYLESPGDAAQSFISYYNSPEVQGITGQRVSMTSLDADPLVGGEQQSYTLTFDIYNISDDSYVGTAASGIYRAACSVGIDTACPSEAPLESAYPITNAGVVAYINGQFTANPLDGEAPLAYRGSPMSSVTLASASTGEVYQVEPAINGGYMLSQTSGDGGDHVMIYGADGTLQNIVSPNLKKFYSTRTN